MFKNRPVPVTALSKREAPYVYTKKAEERAKELGVEPRTAGTIAFFGDQPITGGMLAEAWKEKGYIVER